MDNIKIEDIENSPNGEHLYAEKQICLLEESDTQCGHVFYNEFTRLLKFFCIYCRETYDNIEYFCQHLSEHIKETNELEELYNEIEPEEYKQEEVEFLGDIEESEEKSMLSKEPDKQYPPAVIDDEDTRDAFEYEQELEEKSINTEKTVQDFVGNLPFDQELNNSEMIIEEIEDTEEIRAEFEQEIRESLAEESNLFLPENSSSTEKINCEDKQNLEVASSNADNVKSGNSFEECFIKETNIDKIRSEGVCVLKEKIHKDRKTMQRRSNIQDILSLKRRRKKVTTVKVIAVKNRIAELYERIQNEQQKSQQVFSSDFINVQHEQETQDAIESLINDEQELNNKNNLNTNSTAESDQLITAEVTRKIIGETLITLIPEGTKIPNKLPSPVSKTLKKEIVFKNEQLKQVNTNRYNPSKLDDTKDKLAVCPACGKTFRSHFSLTIHKRIHYLESDSSVKLAHKCSDCDQLFNKLSQLKHHVETVHYSEGFICKICNRQLSSLSLLERHMVKVHLDRPFNCKKCNKNFSDPLTFEEHMASHNSGQVFKCSTCGRKYSTEFFLLEHMRNHKEQVPQTCVVCGKVTLRITQHMKIHTPRPKRVLCCSVCGKVFNFSSGLSHHFKFMHKLPRPTPKPKKESSGNAVKRKRRSRTSERSLNRKKPMALNNSADTPFMIDQDKYSDQIIEEQIEIPQHEVYDTATPSTSSILNLEIQENPVESNNLQSPSQSYITNPQTHNQVINRDLQQQNDVINHKEEEAKRVIVELIQNSTYTSFFPDNLSTVLEVTPPIAREETISAVNSIVHDC